ncbi:hypothetical protein [uncultured Microbacterium sp.]|uniref:hypothetical protein n=1 Tax=uncultured Microbacterium sp. TaxID=191216 RepID=UPI0025EA0654|nr:hypothetical protein [uncultured Microbacterium sp.]
MTEHDDRDLEGLRAHDPAENITAPAGFTDAVMARIGAGVGADAEAQIPDASTHASPEHPTSPEPAPAHTTIDHDPSAPIPLEAARSRRRWLITSAAAASALVLLGGGFAAGSLVGSHDQPTALSAPAIAPVPNGANGTTEGSRAASDATGGVGSTSGGYGGRTVFTASGLGTEASTGQAYTLQPTSDLVSTLRVLAASLGIAGDPITQDGTTRIGDDTGQGKVAYVYADGSFSFSDGTKAWGGGCVVPPATSEGSATQDGPVSGAIQIAPCTNNDASASAPTISSADATARVNDLLKAAGWDASSWRLETMSSDGYVTVTGTLLIDGVESDQTLNAAFVGDDVANAWFSLASATSAGNYPVISPSDAVARLSDPRFGASGGMMPYAAVRADDVGAESGSATTGSAGSDAAPPARFEAGSPIPWPVSRVTITSAERVLTSVWPASATPAAPASEPTSPILVPAYRLSAADGSSWTVIAVADSSLDFG